MYVEENIFLGILFLVSIIYFNFSKKGHLPNLLFLVSSWSKDVSSGSPESPGSDSETVAMVTLWQLLLRLLLAFFFALSAGKNTSHVLSLIPPNITVSSDTFIWLTDTQAHTHGQREMYTQIYSYCVAIIHSLPTQNSPLSRRNTWRPLLRTPQ